MSMFCMHNVNNSFVKNVCFPFQELLRSSVIRQIDLLVVKYFVMAFTLHDVKMSVVVNVYKREHYQMSFVCKCPSFTLYVASLIDIPHGFAFYHTSLQISCVLLASKIDANANLKIIGISHS